MENKSRLGKLACCGTCWGWLTAEIAIFCPMCGKRMIPVFLQAGIDERTTQMNKTPKMRKKIGGTHIAK